jgi:DNA (cytosine-5)-methyltransferase 1
MTTPFSSHPAVNGDCLASCLSRKPSFTFIDLFAGIGGMRRGFEEIDGRCVFASEMDMHARTTYRANYSCDDHELAGDITQIHAEDISAHDVLLAGFPCQPFSLAGLPSRKHNGKPSGFACPSQGSLFFEIVRILAFHRPKVFLLENVKNLIRHDDGRTWGTILQTLCGDLGYSIQSRILNACFWVPQHRERVFIVGFREETGFDFAEMTFPELSAAGVLRDILHPQDGSEEAEPPYTQGKKAQVAERYMLTDALWLSFQQHRQKHREKGNGFGFRLCSPDSISPTLPAHYAQGGAEILIPQTGHNPRRLTPRECSRLMGFDHPGESQFRIPVSDTQAYRQFGNAVVVPVVEAIARHMVPWIHVSPSDTCSYLHQTFEKQKIPLPFPGYCNPLPEITP